MADNNLIMQKCTNSELLKMLDVCPIVKEELYKKSYHILIDAYDATLFTYGMSFLAYPVYKDNYNDDIAYFTYQYTIDNEKYEPNSDWGYNSMAEAQIEAVHATMYKLQERIRKETNYANVRQ